MKYIKSWLIFLSRNQGYTAVNVIGLSVSLMFVLLIGVYVYQETAINRQQDKGDRIEELGFSMTYGGKQEEIVGLHHYIAWQLKKHFPEVEDVCAVNRMDVKATKGDEYLPMTMFCADSTFFRMFNEPHLIEGDPRTCLNDPQAAVINEAFARTLFGDEDPMGKTIVYKDTLRLHVTGVMNDYRRTTLFHPADVIVNFAQERYGNYACTDEGFLDNTCNLSGTACFLQLAPGRTLKGKEKQVTDYIHSIFSYFNDKASPMQAVVFPLNKVYFSQAQIGPGCQRPGNPTMVNILLMVGIVILVFAVLNYINLTVALSGYRSREMATRRLFGASKREIQRRMIVESTLLCFFSLLIAAGLALLLAPAFGKMLNTDLNMATLAQPLSLFVLLAGIIVIGILAGIIPSAVLSRAQPTEVVRGTFRHLTHTRLSAAFIVVQNVFTIALLVTSLTMATQVDHMFKIPMGFRTEGLLNVEKSGTDEQGELFVQRLKNLPCVKAVSASQGTPTNGGNNQTNIIGGKNMSFRIFDVDENFQDVYGLKLKGGGRMKRGHYYLNQRAVNDLRSVGITPEGFYGRQEAEWLQYLCPHGTFGGTFADFHIRSIEEPEHPMLIAVKDTVHYVWQYTIELQGDLAAGYDAVARVYKEAFRMDMSGYGRFMDEELQWAYEDFSRTSQIISMFTLVAIVISILGLVAMSTYFIQQRRNEIAVRKVFGSTGNQIRLRLIRQFMRYVGIAFIIAVPLTWYFVGDWISQFSHRIQWGWFIPLAGVTVALISLAAVAIQSYRASNENPARVIKQE